MARTRKAPHTALIESSGFDPDFASRIDEQNGIIKDVKVLGRKSKNGKEYLDPAHDDAVRLCEGAIVYRNHQYDDSLPGRMVEERLGFLRGLYKKNGETYAKELVLNPETGYYKTFLWEAKNNPRKLGLSIYGDGDGKRVAGTFQVNKIYDVYSVDVVDDPATGSTLWEQSMDETNAIPDSAGATGDWKSHLTNAVSSLATELQAGTMTKEQALAAVKKLFEMIGQEPEASDTPSDAEKTEMVEQLRKLPFKASKWAAKEIYNYKLTEQTSKRLAKAQEKLKGVQLSESFKKQLRNAKDDAEVDELIADRAEVLKLEKKPEQQGRAQIDMKLLEQETRPAGNLKEQTEHQPLDKDNLAKLGADLMKACR
jgi:hypothetical protein